MKLLFDQNLSPRLVGRLADIIPGAAHVQSLGLAASLDSEVWEHARSKNLIIVTKDVDFGELTVLRGAPPKVVWLQLGNCSTDDVESLLRGHQLDIAELEANPGLRVLRLR